MLALNVAMVFNWNLKVSRSYISEYIESGIYKYISSLSLTC